MIDFCILVVENDDTKREEMFNILNTSFKVKATKSGKEALSILDEFEPSLALIDFQIEDMSSVALQQEIASKYPAVHSAMISNVDMSKVSLESMKKRAMDYIYRSDDGDRFLSDVCKLVRYLIDVRSNASKDKEVRASGFYDLAQKLYEEKKWTVEEIKKILQDKK